MSENANEVKCCPTCGQKIRPVKGSSLTNENRLAAYRHAYKVILDDQLDEEDYLPDTASLEDYEKLLKDSGWDLEADNRSCSIIEVDVWE